MPTDERREADSGRSLGARGRNAVATSALSESASESESALSSGTGAAVSKSPPSRQGQRFAGHFSFPAGLNRSAVVFVGSPRRGSVQQDRTGGFSPFASVSTQRESSRARWPGTQQQRASGPQAVATTRYVQRRSRTAMPHAGQKRPPASLTANAQKTTRSAIPVSRRPVPPYDPNGFSGRRFSQMHSGGTSGSPAAFRRRLTARSRLNSCFRTR